MTAAFDQLPLFEIDPAQIVAPPPKLSSDARRTQLQAEKLGAGRHPITGLKLHEQAAPVDDRGAPGRRCGSCRHHEVLPYGRRSYPKCLNPGHRGAAEVEALGPPFVTHGAATDCRAWFPGCVDHTYADKGVSPDAARWVPEEVGSQ